MNTSSRRKTVRALLAAAVLALLPGCDAQGPWEYYPEEVHVYRGVYTYGYVVKDERPVVCLSKLYALDEAAAESFAFYDSAKVTVSGRFGGAGEKALALAPEAKRPNCFTSDEDATGLAGEEYALEVELLWDSAGHRVRSRYSAKGKVPERFAVKSVTIPLHGGGQEVRGNDHSEIPMKVLEFPEDFSVMTAYADFSPDVGGTVIAIRYDSENGGEPTNTTIYNMLKGFLDRDSLGYAGISSYKPEETAVELTYQQNSIVAGVSSLDTIMATASMVAVGHNVFLFYATDWNYLDYNETLLRSFDDARVQPITNVEGGNGVFTGMTRDSLLIEGKADGYVPYSHMRKSDCEDEKWDTKFCRLAMESLCVDTSRTMSYMMYLRPSSYARHSHEGLDFWKNGCFPSLVTAALRFGLEANVLLPDTNDWNGDPSRPELQRKLDSASAKGLRAYCFETDFVSKDNADCSVPEEECRISRERTKCKEEFWTWCADRDWNILDLPQCGSALASRVRLEGLKSAVLDRVVEQWCAEHRTDRQCD